MPKPKLPTSEKRVRIDIRLHPNTLKQAKLLAAQNSISLTRLIETAIKKY